MYVYFRNVKTFTVTYLKNVDRKCHPLSLKDTDKQKRRKMKLFICYILK